MKAFIDFFSSVKLAIFLLIIITLASILGTLIPQQRSVAEYAAQYGRLSTVLIKLQITKLYQSGWYMTLLFLFAFNTSVCTITRFFPKWRRAFKPQVKYDSSNLLSLKINENLKKKTDLNQVKDQVRSVLTQKRYKIKENQDNNQVWLLARKKILGIFGSDIVHLGLITILLGGILSGLSGVRQTLTISEGQTLQVPNAEFQLRLDEFTTEYYPNGSVKDWKSLLTVIENDKEILTRKIEVNHPLSYRGFVFYQSRYGYDWSKPLLSLKVSKQDESGLQDNIDIYIGETKLLSDGKTGIRAIHFVPDFVIGENNEVGSRSNQPNNPAVLIEGYQDGEKIFTGWIFSRYPDFTQIHSNQEKPFALELTKFNASAYSGIDMAKDPGVNFIWIGSTFLMLGLFIAFYWPTREIKFVLQEEKDTVDITAGGISPKNKEALKTDFENIISEIRSYK